MNYDQELGTILDQIPTENLSFFTKDIQILSKQEFGKTWPELNVEDAWLLVTNYREEIPEVWSVLPEDAITLKEETVETCDQCSTVVTEDDFRCPGCDTPLDWVDMSEFAEATETTVMKSLQELGEDTKIHKVKVEGKRTIGDREKEVSTLVDTP